MPDEGIPLFHAQDGNPRAMSTRGAYGFKIDGHYKITYNHFDSYPNGLGARVVAQWRALNQELGHDLANAARAVKLCSSDAIAPKSAFDVARMCLARQLESEAPGAFDHSAARDALRRWTNRAQHRLTNQVSLRDLVHDVDDKLYFAFRARAMGDSFDFTRDSLMCEWAYFIDIDAALLEVYRGFCREPHLQGPFAMLEPWTSRGKGRDYYPIRQVARLDLTDIDEDWTELLTIGVEIASDPSAAEDLDATAHDALRAAAFLEKHAAQPWSHESAAQPAPLATS